MEGFDMKKITDILTNFQKKMGSFSKLRLAIIVVLLIMAGIGSHNSAGTKAGPHNRGFYRYSTVNTKNPPIAIKEIDVDLNANARIILQNNTGRPLKELNVIVTRSDILGQEIDHIVLTKKAKIKKGESVAFTGSIAAVDQGVFGCSLWGVDYKFDK